MWWQTRLIMPMKWAELILSCGLFSEPPKSNKFPARDGSSRSSMRHRRCQRHVNGVKGRPTAFVGKSWHGHLEIEWQSQSFHFAFYPLHPGFWCCKLRVRSSIPVHLLSLKFGRIIFLDLRTGGQQHPVAAFSRLVVINGDSTFRCNHCDILFLTNLFCSNGRRIGSWTYSRRCTLRQ